MSDLNTCFGEVKPHGELLAGEDVGVLRFLEGSFQLVQLERGEGRTRAAHLPVGLLLLRLLRLLLRHCFRRRPTPHQKHLLFQ